MVKVYVSGKMTIKIGKKERIRMGNAIDEASFLGFYRDSVLNYSVAMKTAIRQKLQDAGKITFDKQTSLTDTDQFPIFFPDKGNIDSIISRTTMNSEFSNFYENWEFIKLYKYSVPLFFQASNSIGELLKESDVQEFKEKKYTSPRILPTELKDAIPIYKKIKNNFAIKFVLQKSYFDIANTTQTDYIYPVIIYFDIEANVSEIRYDAFKYGSTLAGNNYEEIVNQCIEWLKDKLGINLFNCDHKDTIDKIKDENDSSVKIYKQMMELSSGGSAELTAAQDREYLLPFVGELRELINENTDLFDKSPDIKQLLKNYLDDKEQTANYPYIYVNWVQPIASQSYIVKITFDYLQGKYTVLQHLTGTCKDLGMERMNDAIKYLCKSSSFTKGAEI